MDGWMDVILYFLYFSYLYLYFADLKYKIDFLYSYIASIILSIHPKPKQ